MTDLPRLGDAVPTIAYHADEVRLFCYSALTWNPHRIHFDHPYATGTEGYPGLVVQGPLLGGLILRSASEWAGGRGRVVGSRYRSSRPAFAGEQLTCTGEITDVTETDGRTIEVTLDMAVRLADGTPACTGVVRVALDDGAAR